MTCEKASPEAPIADLTKEIRSAQGTGPPASSETAREASPARVQVQVHRLIRALVNHHQRVGDRVEHLGQVAGHEDGPAFIAEPQERTVQGDVGHHVQAVVRLVEQHVAGVADQRAHELHLLLHPRGIGVERIVDEGVHLQLGDEPVQRRVGVALAGLQEAQVFQVLAAGEPREEVVVVGQESQVPLQRVDVVVLPQVPPVDEHRAPIGGEQPHDQPHRGGLARSVAPQEAGQPGLQPQADVEHTLAVAEGLAHADELDHVAGTQSSTVEPWYLNEAPG